MKVTFPLALFLVFLVLKLTHVISWSWWWVTAPLWYGFGIAVVTILVSAAVIGGSAGIRVLRKRR